MDESEESSNIINAVEWQKLLEGCSVDGNYIHGYVSTEASSHTVLELYRRITTTTFCVRDSTSLQFSPNQVDKEKVKFSSRTIQFSKSKNPHIPYDGVPFLFGGKKILECPFGPKREHEKRCSLTMTMHDFDHDYAPTLGQTPDSKQTLRVRDTRKRGCEAKVTIKQMCRFPEYALLNTKNLSREQLRVKEKLLLDLEEGVEVCVENRYYVQLPLHKAHTNHTLGGLSGMAQTVHPQITQWIDQLVGEGVTDSTEMQATLRQFVRTRMTDPVAPSEFDRAYYPKLKDIRNHIYMAKVRRKSSRLDQENPSRAVEDWGADGAHAIFRPRRRKKPESKTASGVEAAGGAEGAPVRVVDEDGEKTLLLELQEAESERDPAEHGDPYIATTPRRKSRNRPKAVVSRSRMRAHQELDVLRAMTFNCTDLQALDALTKGIRALQESFKQFLDESPEGLPLVSRSSDRARGTEGTEANREQDGSDFTC